MTQSTTVTMTARRPRLGLMRNVYLGIVRGDYAPEMNFSGRLTQAICGFIPGFNILFAFRDFLADRKIHDRLGMALNALALIPGLGGFPKTAAVIHSVHYLGGAIHHVSRKPDSTNSPMA